MTSLINFSVGDTHLSVAPGASIEFVVTVQNLTTLLDQVAVSLIGIDPAWVQVIPQQLPIFAQTQADARVIVSPPSDATKSLAGTYPLRVTGASLENKGQEGETTTELEVQLVGDYELRAGASGPGGGPETSFPITVKNLSNAALQVRLAGSDQGDALWYKFEPFQLVVPAGTDGLAKVTVRAKPGAGNKGNVIFNLTARGEYLLKGGAQTTAPAHQLSGQFTRAAPAPLTLSMRAVPTRDSSASVFEVRIANPNLAPVTVRLDGQGKTSSLNFEFAPPELPLAAQGSGRSMVVVRPASPPMSGAPQSEIFQVSARIVAGEAQEASAEAAFTPVPVGQKPTSLWPILLIVLLGFVITAVILLLLYIGLGLFR